MLTPEQLAKFEFRVRVLRPDLIDRGLRATMPEAPPDEPSPDDEAGQTDE
jgi:hypothetical protein